jgi:hypothetical protein
MSRSAVQKPIPKALAWVVVIVVAVFVVAVAAIAIVDVSLSGTCVLGGSCGPGKIDFEALQAAHEQPPIRARETCELVPPSTADRIVAGISPTIQGAWRGQPGKEFPIEEVWLTACGWPPSAHVVEVRAVISGGTSVWIPVLVEGSLEAPDSIKFLANRPTVPNPTSFERSVHDSWPSEALLWCGEAGAVVGPYPADQIGLDF